MTAEQVLSKFMEFDSRLFDALSNIFGGDRNQMLSFVASQQFEQLLIDMGMQQLVTDYVSGLDIISNSTLSGFSKVEFTAQEINRVQITLDLVKNTHERTLVGYFTANSELVRSELIKSIASGQSSQETINNLRAKYIRQSDNTLHIITDANIGTLVNTSYMDQARLTAITAFEDRPEQRFYYVETRTPTSSRQCSWLAENQRPEGYTMAEIRKGIVTPFGIINEYGRVPNYNCDEMWYPII